jgi:hypothetical protein
MKAEELRDRIKRVSLPYFDQDKPCTCETCLSRAGVRTELILSQIRQVVGELKAPKPAKFSGEGLAEFEFANGFAACLKAVDKLLGGE